MRTPLERPRPIWSIVIIAFAMAGCFDDAPRGNGLGVYVETDHKGQYHWIEFQNAVWTVKQYYGNGGFVNLDCEDASRHGTIPNWWQRIAVFESNPQAWEGPRLDRQNFTGLQCPSAVLLAVDASGRFTLSAYDDDYEGKPFPTGRRE